MLEIFVGGWIGSSGVAISLLLNDPTPVINNTANIKVTNIFFMYIPPVELQLNSRTLF